MGRIVRDGVQAYEVADAGRRLIILMKRKLVMILCVICCLGQAACGNPEKQSSGVVEKEEVAGEDESEKEDTVGTSGETESVRDAATEEVIGDADAAEGLTMADMTEQVIGVDIPMAASEGTDKETFKDFTVIFPSPEFITDYSEGGAEARLESIWFVISARMVVCGPDNNIRPEMGESQEYIGENYVLEKNAGRNNEYGYQVSYHIIDTRNDNNLMITLTINKEEEYQEYGDKLAEEFAAAFEEAVRNNIQ